MPIKTKNFRLTRVEAPTMQEALQKVRAQLGSEAMIVRTRTFRRGGVLGVGAQEVVEVYAADTRSRIENIRRESLKRAGHPEVVPPPVLPEEPGRNQRLPALEAVAPVDAPSPLAAPAYQSSPPHLASVPAETPRGPVPLQPGLSDLLVSPQEGPRQLSSFLRECHETLINREIEPRVADLIVEQISHLRIPSGYPEPSRVRAVLRGQLTKLFVASPPAEERRRPRLVVLMGPTGVGKTTTIAKLAARTKLHERRRVGLITLDTFRIAAVDQLEKYAEIIGLPLIIATSPQELEIAVEEFRAKETDVVFIDTAGRSHRDELKMAELREFLAVLPDAEVHLVLSTTTHGKTILSVANRFSGLGFDRVILTKVDETISFGSLVSALIAIGRPVSYVTDGQNVPDDIVPSDPERLADLVLKVNAL